MVRIVISLSGWIILLLYLIYDYQIYGAELLSHFINPTNEPAQFIFHSMIFLAPVITTYAGYLIHQNDKVLKKTNEMTDKLQETLLIVEEEKTKSDAIIAGIGDAISIQATNYKILYQNQVHKDIIGDHVGDYCYQAYENRDSVCEGCPVTMCFQDGNIHKAERSTIIDKGEIHVEVTASPLKTSSGEIISGIEVVRDVTERKTLEERLRIQRNQAQQYLDVAGVILLVLDKYQNITLINKKGYEILGYQEGELIGKNWFDLCIPDKMRKDVKDVFDRFMAGELELTEYYENSVTTKNGDERIIAWHYSILRDEQNNITGVLSSGEDITEKKKLEAQLLHAQKMEAVGQLAGGVAHDFNNILTAIVGYGNITQKQLDKDNPLRANLDKILSAAEKATHLTQSLLAFSRKKIIETKLVGLNNIVKGIEQILLRIIGEDIELRTQLTAGHLAIYAERGQLEQVLMNLATNARDAMPDGGRLLIETKQVEIDSKFEKTHEYCKPGRYAHLIVSDTGEGIDEGTRERIFEPFFTTKEVGKGTGLGLSMTYGIVKQHNGYINVSSKLGEGTTFQIYLPLIQAEVEETISEELPTPEGGTETILFAEDDENIREFMKEALTAHGYNIIDSYDGEDAINKFIENEENIQLLISDVIMPKKNGKEVYDEIRKIRPDMKALFLSGYAEDKIQKKGVLEEGLHFVYKPISLNDLLLKVREVLD
jgi:PAS domain S-box-containing protein